MTFEFFNTKFYHARWKQKQPFTFWYCVDIFYPWKDIVGRKVSKLRSIAELKALYDTDDSISISLACSALNVFFGSTNGLQLCRKRDASAARVSGHGENGGGGHGQEGGAHPGQAAQGLQGLHPTQGKRGWRWTWTGRRSSSWPSSSGPAGSPSYPG
jgi:hypothetical protein